MSKLRYENFVYIERNCRRLLFIKTVLTEQGLDFDFEIDEVLCFRVPSEEPIEAENKKFPPELAEFQTANPTSPDRKTRKRLQKLRRKLKVLVLVKTNIFLFQRQLGAGFSEEAIEKLVIRPENKPLIKEFCNKEKALLMKSSSDFFSDFTTKINAAQSVPEIDDLFRHIRRNVSVNAAGLLSD